MPDTAASAGPRRSLELAAPVPAVLADLHHALGGPVVLAGGWAVTCRLLRKGVAHRRTEDLDVIVPTHLRPARERLRVLGAAQADPCRATRLGGLALPVDLLAADEPAVLAGHEPAAVVEDDDGLRLRRPPQARLLVRTAGFARVSHGHRTAEVLLPRAGPLVAAKLGDITLEGRGRRIEADAIDLAGLVHAYGGEALADDLAPSAPKERDAVVSALDHLGPSAINTLAGGTAADLVDLDRQLQALLDGLRRPRRAPARP